jgi:hypothetical protein
MGRLKIYDQTSGQFIDINLFPHKETISFTTVEVNAFGQNEEINEPGFNVRSLVRKLKVTPNGIPPAAFQVDFYRSSAFEEAKLEYRAVASGTFVDNDTWFHEDEDNVGELHLKITNSAAENSTYTVEITSEAFS